MLWPFSPLSLSLFALAFSFSLGFFSSLSLSLIALAFSPLFPSSFITLSRTYIYIYKILFFAPASSLSLLSWSFLLLFVLACSLSLHKFYFGLFFSLTFSAFSPLSLSLSLSLSPLFFSFLLTVSAFSSLSLSHITVFSSLPNYFFLKKLNHRSD